MKKDREEMLGKYDVKKLLIKLSIPAVLGMVVNALYNFVDTLFVAQGAGEIAIGGLALAFPIQMIAIAFSLMIGIGSASVFSRAFGRRDYKKMDQAVNSALRVGFIGALTIAVIGTIYIDELLIFFGASASNIGFAKDYLSIILIGLVFTSLNMILNNLTRAEGRPNIAMISMMIGTGLNIILDPIFIFDFGFGLGVQGAAIATVISQIVAFVYIFSQSLTKKSSLNINLKGALLIDIQTVKETIAVGFPTFLRNSLGAFLAIIIYRLINQYAEGDPAIYISIYGVINRVVMFIFLPGFGVVQGLVPIVGFNYGAQNYDRLKLAIKYATKFIALYFVGGFIFIQLFSKFIFTIFSEDNNLFFINYGSEAFKIMSIGFLLVGFQIVVSSIFQALGYPLRAMLIALSRQIIFFIPIAFVLTSWMGIDGIWIAFASADILSGLISIALLFYAIKGIGKFETKTYEPVDDVIQEVI
ncbi:MAG: MATE family efflux transporter [Tenericutes bacterium]|nr:MATE family efflux transporter [Mycoplasmatota bacterium]